MILKIKKQTVVNGKPAKIGYEFDAQILSPREAKILLATGKAEIVKPLPAKIETAEANPNAEVADATPKRGRKSKAQ